MTVGFAMCGSFCTFSNLFPVMRRLSEEYDLIPIFSRSVCTVSSRFGTPEEFRARAEEICGKPPLDTIALAEPIGPKKLLDVLVIAPCTGNTLSKLARGTADSAVTLAAKAHLRNQRPIVLAISSNDALAGNAVSLGSLLTRKHFYFVPFSQDDPLGKPCSLVANMEKIPETCALGLTGDCGVLALLFLTLCRCAGIPAQWQSGLTAEPDAPAQADAKAKEEEDDPFAGLFSQGAK